MMFAVLGYQHTNADVLDALATARAHLDVGGLFAFDVWYGPAVLSERPSERVKVDRGRRPADHPCRLGQPRRAATTSARSTTACGRSTETGSSTK